MPFMPSLTLISSPSGGFAEMFAYECTQCACGQNNHLWIFVFASESKTKGHERPAGSTNIIVPVVHLFLWGRAGKILWKSCTFVLWNTIVLRNIFSCNKQGNVFSVPSSYIRKAHHGNQIKLHIRTREKETAKCICFMSFNKGEISSISDQ